MSTCVVAEAADVVAIAADDSDAVQPLADRLLRAVEIGEVDRPCPFCDGRLSAPAWTGRGVQVVNRSGRTWREIRHTVPACREFGLLAEGGQAEAPAP